LAKPKNTAPNRKSKRITLARIAPAGANKEDDLNGGSWSVQVGAYNRFAPAHLAAGHAAQLLPALRGAGVTV